MIHPFFITRRLVTVSIYLISVIPVMGVIDTYCEIDINIGSNTIILLRVGIVMGRNKKLKYAYFITYDSLELNYMFQFRCNF